MNDLPPSFYSHHVFFCGNRRSPGERTCCADKNADAMRDYAKKRVKELGLAGPTRTRINQAGCLDRCEKGPCMVVYPQGVWYRYENQQDIDEIIEKHLRQNRVVERLLIR